MTLHIEPEPKISAKIAKAKICHMSNAKWRKLFRLLHDLPGSLQGIGLKRVGHKVIGIPIPAPECLSDDSFETAGALDKVPYAHIDYIGISNSRITNAELIAFLSKYGNWPFKEEDEGVLIIGYEWV